MGRRPFTVTLEEEDVIEIQRLSESLGLSASAILRAAAQAVIAEPSLIVRRALVTSKQTGKRTKLTAVSEAAE